MSCRFKIILLFLLLGIYPLMADELTWNGGVDNDFFNELNWKSVSGTSPESGSLDPNKVINHQLVIANSASEVLASGAIYLGSESLTVTNASLKAGVIDNGFIVIGQDGYVWLDADMPLTGTAEVNFKPNAGWLKLSALDPKLTLSNYIHRFKINGSAAKYQQNVRIDNYYAYGSMVRPDDADLAPLTVFSEMNQTGISASLNTDIIHSGNSIPNGLNNNISSFILKRGFMAVMADNDNGTGISKVFIASEKDLELNEMPDNLKDMVSFIRVLPWNWVAKKGIGGKKTGFNETWFYYWGNWGVSSIDAEYAPMAWGKSGADDDNDIALYRSKYKSTHVMAFNESDNCNDQSGAVGNLCQIDVAVPIYENLMKTGMRMVSPSCREDAPFGWLKNFYDKATAQNIRIDVIGVHWYDWGSNPKNSPNEDPQKIFNRFKNYLDRVYNLYKLPIWITEFNGNPNRSTASNKGFMELALPYLEQLDYIERYAWFEPSSGNADYYESDGTTLTEVGEYFYNFKSTPAVPEDYLLSPSNLDKNISEVFEYFDDFESYTHGENLDGIYTVWEGSATAVDVTQSSVYGTPYAGNKFGKSDDAKINFYLRKTFNLEVGKTYIWELSTRMTFGLKHVMSVLPEDKYTILNCYNKEWEKHGIEFTVVDGAEQVTLALFRYYNKEVFFDNFHLKEKVTGTPIREMSSTTKVGQIVPNPSCNHISITNVPVGAVIKFYTLQGTCIYKTQYHDNLDISFLKNSVYLIYTPSEVLKLIKQ